jgi:hypothetical protein
VIEFIVTVWIFARSAAYPHDHVGGRIATVLALFHQAEFAFAENI